MECVQLACEWQSLAEEHADGPVRATGISFDSDAKPCDKRMSPKGSKNKFPQSTKTV